MSLTFDSLDYAWWPYLFILLAGAVPTDIWRWLGVVAGGALEEGGEALIWVRCVATALVAGVVGQLIVFPSGALAGAPLLLRVAAAALGWTAFMATRRSPLAGVVVAEAVLIGGQLAMGEW